MIARNRRGQSGLWGYGISGDLPIVLLRDRATRAKIDLVRQLVQAHAYWRLKGLAVDLVIWNEDHSGYRQVLQDQIMGVIASGAEAQPGRPARRHLRAPGEQMSEDDRSCCRRWRASSSATPPARWPSRWSAAAAREVPVPRSRRLARRRAEIA